MEQDKICNMFTKYVCTAIERAKRDYMNKNTRRNIMEYPAEEIQGENNAICNEWAWEQRDLEAAARLPFEPKSVRSYLKEQVDGEKWKALSDLSDSEILILFAKVFLQLTFMEIGNMMEKDWKSIASSYSYVRKKLKKAWSKDGD